MDFEQMQKVWQTQACKPQFSVDEEKLSQKVSSQQQHIQFMANLVEWGLVAVSLALILFALQKASLDSAPHHWMTMFLFSGVMLYMVWDRRKRKQRDHLKGQGVSADLDVAIHHLEHLVRRQKYFYLWFLTPAAVVMVTRAIDDISSKPMWMWILMPLAFVVIGFLARWELNNRLLPKLKELKELRKMLMEGEL